MGLMWTRLLRLYYEMLVGESSPAYKMRIKDMTTKNRIEEAINKITDVDGDNKNGDNKNGDNKITDVDVAWCGELKLLDALITYESVRAEELCNFKTKSRELVAQAHRATQELEDQIVEGQKKTIQLIGDCLCASRSKIKSGIDQSMSIAEMHSYIEGAVIPECDSMHAEVTKISQDGVDYENERKEKASEIQDTLNKRLASLKETMDGKIMLHRINYRDYKNVSFAWIT